MKQLSNVHMEHEGSKVAKFNEKSRKVLRIAFSERDVAALF